MSGGYKRQKDFDERRSESQDILERFPGHIPIIAEKDPRSSLPDIARPKVLIPGNVTVSNLVVVIRQRIDIGPTDAVFLFVGGRLPSASATIASLYETDKDSDGFLYVTYGSESAYGGHHGVFE
jgi:GABA(A) receptor-associated protein